MKNTKGEFGFTLVEVASALVILSVAMVSILGMFYVGGKAIRLNEQKTIAYSLLQRKMEEVLSKGFANIASASDEGYAGFADYTIDTTVTALSSTMKQIEVAVQWQGAIGGTMQEAITTKVTNTERTQAPKKSGKRERWDSGTRGRREKDDDD